MPQTPECRAPRFSALLWALFGLANIAAAAEKQSPPARQLTPDRVLELAIAAFSRTDAGSRPYRPLPPEFHADTSAWWVRFAQTGSWVKVDGDMLVVIDDRTGRACVQQFAAVGQCI
jgi:hypothetical protein